MFWACSITFSLSCYSRDMFVWYSYHHPPSHDLNKQSHVSNHLSNLQSLPKIVAKTSVLLGKCFKVPPSPQYQSCFSLCQVRLLYEHWQKGEGGIVTFLVIYCSFATILWQGLSEKPVKQNLQLLQCLPE